MLATNRIPLRPSPALPISADEMGQVKRSIEKVLAPGAKTIYPARDRPFLADALKPEIAGM